MKLLPVANLFAGKGPGFNRQTAEVVYRAMTAMHPDEALMFGRMLIGELNHADLMRHFVGISKIADERAAARAAALRSHYARDAVAKARRGEDNTRELGVLVEIAKIWPFSSSNLSNRAKNQPRSPLGRFIAVHTKIDTDEGKVAEDQKTAKERGIPKVKLTGANVSHYQQAHQQISDLLAPYLHPDLSSMLHLNVKDGANEERRQTLRVEGGKVPDFGRHLNDGDTIQSAEVSVSPQINTSTGMVHHIMRGAGASPEQAARIGTAYGGLANKDNLKILGGEKLNAESPEAYSSATAAFGRIERGSRYLSQSMNEVAPPQLQFALAAANHVGQFGPEAQKVIGPFADRTAYRYRGTERRVSQRLGGELDRLRHDTNLKTPSARRRFAVTGAVTDEGGKQVWNPGPVLSYFHDHLPDADLNELQRRSGVIPPSEGIIFNREGQVTAQSVGYADDWYLPFNLKNLAALQGGEYIRTRSFGGPTTEDIYTGLVSGARSVTVVSHNGVYNIEFDPALRGGRRFNDKAARMVGRYGHLLDALRSKQVSRGAVAPSRMRELEAEVARREPDRGSRAFRVEMQRRVDQERLDPILSGEQRDAAATEWLEEQADRVTTADGNPPTLQEFEESVINTSAKRMLASHKEAMANAGMRPEFGLNDYQRQAAGHLLTGTREQVAQKIADEMGQRRSYDLAMRRAEVANAERISPLSLNGKGYDDALHALKEQFPYYIADVTYHPWSEAMGMAGRAHTGALDTGYVPARHLRPEKAEAGYFNVDVMGPAGGKDKKSGKVFAHTIRYQNRRVHDGPRAVPYKGKGMDEDDGYSGSTGGGGGGDTGNTGKPITAERKEAQRRVADQAALKAFLGAKTFEPDTKLKVAGGGMGPFGGVDIRSVVNDERFVDPDVKAIYGGRDEDELMSDLADPVKAEKLRKAMTALIASGAIKIPDDVARAFRNKGQVEEAKPMPDTVAARLAEGKVDHTFSGTAYDATKNPDVTTIVDTYNDHDDIRDLRSRGELPGIASGKFEDAAKALKSRLRDQDMELVGQEARGRLVDRGVQRQVERDSEAWLRATQLRRRYDEAKKNEPKPPADGSLSPEESKEFDRITNYFLVDPTRLGEPEYRDTVDAVSRGALSHLPSTSSTPPKPPKRRKP